MKRTIICVTLAAGLAAQAPAHPTNIPFDTRGECEAVYAESSKLDRERLVELGVFPTNGAAQRTFNETFRCEYDEDLDAWFIVLLVPPQG